MSFGDLKRRAKQRLEKYVVGREVFLSMPWAGYPGGLIGWVISPYPETRVAFANGAIVDVNDDLDERIGVTDVVDYDIEGILEDIEEVYWGKNKRVKRRA